MKINFSNRLGREDFVIAFILSDVIVWVPALLLWAVLKFIDVVFASEITSTGIIAWALLVVPLVSSVVLSLSALVRRHHDLNQFWGVPAITTFVIFVLATVNGDIGRLMGFVYLLYLAFSKSVIEDNKYGEAMSYHNIWEKLGLKK